MEAWQWHGCPTVLCCIRTSGCCSRAGTEDGHLPTLWPELDSLKLPLAMDQRMGCPCTPQQDPITSSYVLALSLLSSLFYFSFFFLLFSLLHLPLYVFISVLLLQFGFMVVFILWLRGDALCKACRSYCCWHESPPRAERCLGPQAVIWPSGHGHEYSWQGSALWKQGAAWSLTRRDSASCGFLCFLCSTLLDSSQLSLGFLCRGIRLG